MIKELSHRTNSPHPSSFGLVQPRIQLNCNHISHVRSYGPRLVSLVERKSPLVCLPDFLHLSCPRVGWGNIRIALSLRNTLLRPHQLAYLTSSSWKWPRDDSHPFSKHLSECNFILGKTFVIFSSLPETNKHQGTSCGAVIEIFPFFSFSSFSSCLFL